MMLMEKVAEMEAMIILAGTVVVKVIYVPPFLLVCIAPTFFLYVACFYLLMKKVRRIGALFSFCYHSLFSFGSNYLLTQ